MVHVNIQHLSLFDILDCWTFPVVSYDLVPFSCQISLKCDLKNGALCTVHHFHLVGHLFYDRSIEALA